MMYVLIGAGELAGGTDKCTVHAYDPPPGTLSSTRVLLPSPILIVFIFVVLSLFSFS